MIINLDIISWQVCLVVLVIVFFFIYLFFGGGDHEYIGLSPLEIGFDASRHVEHCSKKEKNADIVSNSPVDNTPSIPNLSKVPLIKKKMKNVFCSSGSSSYERYSSEPSLGDLVGNSNSYSDSYSESYENIQTPRTAALGGFCKRKNGFSSKGEKLCKQAIEEIYGVPFFCVRPDFLKNPETGRNLELDLFNAKLGIAVEYSGSQHYIFPNNFHKTYEDFINSVRRDQYKVDACDENGVYLITVPYNIPLNIEEIKKYITYYLPENAHLRN